MLTTERLTRRMGWLTLAGGALVLLFWTLYFAGVIALTQREPALDGFESAFVLPDGALILTLFGASHGLFRGKRVGPFLLVMAASMCLYLGLLDVTFYAQQGLYSPLTSAGAVELAINALCVGGGALGARCGWTLWREG